MARYSRTYGTGRVYQQPYRDKSGKKKLSKRYSVCYWKNGVEHRESTGKTLYGEALAILKDRLAGILPNVPTPSADIVTIDTLLKYVEEDYTQNRRSDLKKLQQTRFPPLRAAFAGEDMALLKRKDLLAYRRRRLAAVIPVGKKNAGQKYSNATVNRELAVLSRGFKLAIENQQLETAPILSKIREASPRKGFFEYDAFQIVLDQIDPWWHELYTIAYVTGWRIDNEICQMQWAQIDFRNGHMRLEPGTTKNGEGRTFGFTPMLEKALKAQRQRVDRLQERQGKIVPWVFPRQHTLQPLTSAYKPFKAAAIAAGRPEALQHDFRRTAIRNLELAGVDRATAKMMVGHRTDSVYERYNIVDKRRLDIGTKKLAEYEAGLKQVAS